jgi:hypothetical protein
VIQRFVSREYAPDVQSLGLYRILFALFALGYTLPDYLWISGFSDSFFNPPLGITPFFTGFPSLLFFQGLNILLITCAVFILFGHWTVTASILFSAGIFIGNSWAYSFGKINHDLLLMLTPVLMSIAGWGAANSMDARQGKDTKTRPWALSLMALIVALAMFTAAYAKIAGGWLNSETHATLGHLIRNVYSAGRDSIFAKVALSVKSGIFWESFDVSTIVIEAAFLAAVMNRRAFRIVCAVACFFHVGVALLMQINFTSNLIAYAAFFPWAVAVQMSVTTRWIASRRTWHLSAFSAALSLGYLTIGNPVKAYSAEVGTAVCLVAAALATLFLLRQFASPSTQPSRTEPRAATA